MAAQKRLNGMVFHKDGTNVAAKPSRPEQPPPSFVLLKRVRTEKVEDGMKKPSAGGASPTKAVLENLPAQISCHGLSVTLDNNVMWNEFFRCQTEMILTQDGSRMFPYCRFRISGLDASKKYSLVVDIQPVDSSQYEWTGHNWQVAGKAMRHSKSRPFCHPDSPATGQHWMEQPVSFYKLKLTNQVPGQGNLVLHPLHRYIPRLHIVPFSTNAKKELKLSDPRVATFSFPQTEFFAVTAYQNSRFTQLKVNYNPFAKGLKDERSGSLALKPQTSDNKEADPSNNQNPTVKKNFKSLLANHKPRSSTAADHNHSEILIPTTTSSTEELYSKAKPSQKLFSELIREAHVSLRRCNVDKMVASLKSYTGNKLKEAVTEIELPLPADCTAVDASRPSKSLVVSSLDCKSKSEPQPEENVRTNKRPALVPLPALARFLSKHQSKRRNLGTRQEPLNIPPSELPPPSKAAPGVQSTVGSHSGSHCISPLSTLHHQEPTPQIVVPQPKELDSTPLSLSTDLPLSTAQQIHFPTAGLPTAIDTYLADISNSSTIARSGSTNKPAPFLLDSSAIGFESLSPVSSPEHLPLLPVSLELETGPPPSVVNTTLKWHSLFPQPDPFLTSFTPFSARQSPTLNPTALPCQEAPSVSSDPLLHEDEYQSLPFPGDLSPLTLQLSLSPSFSSLDGGALSPTSSLSDLLSFITTDNHNLLMEAEVGKAEPVPVPCPALLLTHPIPRPPPCPQVQSELEPTTKPAKVKKKCRKGQSKGAITACDAVYTKMQPSLEEVEEQLFVSFTSKEALKLHLQDLPEGPVTQSLEASKEDPQPTTSLPEGELPQPSTPPAGTGGIGAPATGGPVSPDEGPEDITEGIAAIQMILLRDLKLMKNRQVIHPVLQEVGLKMHLLDPAMVIDLQYLGVHLPIPPHPVCLDAQASPPQAASPQTPPHLPPQSVCLDFVSRTGKTSDLTQIKGWREKFSPSESSASLSSSKPEAAASAEPPSKNLSAFCSDMLDEYLENEGKFLDQQASSFTQAPPEPLAYKLPTQSSSYVRTLSSVLKMQPLSAPTSALISSFVPPSKRPRPLPTTHHPSPKKSKADKKQKPGRSKLKSKPGPGTGDSAPTNSSTASVSAKAAPAGPEPPLTQPLTLATIPAHLGLPSAHPPVMSQTQDRSEANPAPAAPPSTSAVNHTASKKTKKLKPPAKDSPSDGQEPVPGHRDLAPLELDSELDPGGDKAHSRPPRPKALVSVTLLKQRDLEERVVWEGRARTFITEGRASIALTSLFTSAGFVREDPTAPIQLAECRTPPCLNDFCRLGCVCSSLAHARPITHCGKAQCMLGCSCLRQKVVLLKNLDSSDSSALGLDPSKRKRRKRRKRMKMAYVLKETESVAQPAQPVRTLWKGGDLDPEPMYTAMSNVQMIQARRTSNYGMTCARVRLYTGRKTLRPPQTAECLKEAEDQPAQTRNKTALPTGLPQLTSAHSGEDLPKHLVIVADCRWPSPEVQNQVLKAVCQAMARERLHIPFWINGYHAKLLNFTVKDGAIHYKVHISEGKPGGSKPPLASSSPAQTRPGKTPPMRRGRRNVEGEEAVEDWQKEVEDWQKEVEEEDEDPEEGKMTKRMALPFLAGLSHAGFLTAHLKESGGDNPLVQVNGKSYPMAMVQLGRMGALHPANRLAAYLTGRAVPPAPRASLASRGAAAVTTATVPPGAPAVPSGQRSAWPGSAVVQPGHYYLYTTAVTRRLVRLVPLGQTGAPDAPDGTPRPDKDGRPTAGPPAGALARPAGTCQLQLVSNHCSIIVNLPTLPPLAQTDSSGTQKSIEPAPSGGTDQNLSAAASSLTELNIICVDREPGVLTNEQQVGVAGMSKEEPASVDPQRNRPRPRATLRREQDIDSVEEKKEEEERRWPGKDRRCLDAAFKALRSELHTKTRVKVDILAEAYSVICDLHAEETRCQEEMEALKHQRSNLIGTISARSGRSNRKILEKLQSITAKQRQLEEMRPTAWPAGGSTHLDLTVTPLPSNPPPSLKLARPHRQEPRCPPPPPIPLPLSCGGGPCPTSCPAPSQALASHMTLLWRRARDVKVNSIFRISAKAWCILLSKVLYADRERPLRRPSKRPSPCSPGASRIF